MTGTEDRLALADLVARYALAVDRRDGQALRALFAPGATMVLPAVLGGDGTEQPLGDPADLLSSLAGFEATRHTIAQQVVDASPDTDSPDTASAVTYAEAHHLYRRNGELRDFAVALRYLDRFARTPGGWRFVRRELAVDWTQRLVVGF
jgi:hypothetical protein